MNPIITKLSDILEEDADPKYYLSSKACQGILNRANKRNKQLPEILQKALENQVESNTTCATSRNTVPATLTDAEKEQIEDFVSAVNKDAKHQQDLLQSDLGIARTIAPGTHAAGSHLTKTLTTSAVDKI